MINKLNNMIGKLNNVDKLAVYRYIIVILAVCLLCFLMFNTILWSKYSYNYSIHKYYAHQLLGYDYLVLWVDWYFIQRPVGKHN